MTYAVTMMKSYLGTYGDLFEIELSNIEKGFKGRPNYVPPVKLRISEHEANRLKSMFTHHKTSGQHNENEEWS